MRFDLTDLRLFLTVVECGSLTQGARSLHLALASISERIASMESTLGTPLLERNRRGVRPTDAGNALVRHARLILGHVETMRGELRSYATGLKGRIRLLSNSAAMASFLPAELCEFLAAHRDLSIDLEERTSSDIVQSLMNQRADLGLVADTTDFGTLQTQQIGTDQLVVVAGRSHHFAHQGSVLFADVLREPIVGVADAALEVYLGERASRFGGQLNYRIKLRNIHNVAMNVEAGVGISIVSSEVARFLGGNLVVLPLQEEWARRHLYLCVRDFSALTPHAGLLADQLLKRTR
jgi:DNA-binding transcriptional LysR family regulator